MTINAQSRNDVTAIKRNLHRDTDLAVLGQTSDASSAVFVNDRPGYWWIREIQAGGTYGPPIQVRGCLIAMVTNPGVPVRLGVVEGEKQVIGPDFVGLLSQGVNPTQAAVVDPNANNQGFVNQSYITTAYGQIVERTLFVAIRGWLILASGTWSKLDTNIGPLTVPGAGDHCLAVIAVQSDGVTLEVQYSTDKSLLIPLDIDDLNEAWSAMADPTTNAPLWAFELADGQTEIVESNRWADLRQMINFVMGGGGSGTVTSVTAGTGLDSTPNPITTTGTIDLADTTVTPGSYTNTSLTVDQQGRLTAASSGAAPAPSTASYITKVAESGLSNEFALGSLATGLLKNTTTTGVPSIATPGTDYTSPTGTENLSNKTITASSLNSTPIGASSASTAIVTALSILIGGFKGIFTHANTADRTYTTQDADGTLAFTDKAGQGYIRTGPAADSDNVISVATTTIRALALKTTDNNTTKKLLEFLSSAGAVLASIGATGLAVFAGIDSTPIGQTTAAAGYFSALRELIGGFFAIFTHANTADRTYTLPDISDILANQLELDIFYEGDGSDGDLTASSGTTTFVRDMYYHNITLTGTAKINTNSFRFFWNGNVDLTNAPAGAIFSSGGNGGAGGVLTGGTHSGGGSDNTVGDGTAAGDGAAGRNTTGNGANGSNATNSAPGNGGAGGSGGNGGQGTTTSGGAGGTGGTVTQAMIFHRFAVDLLRGASLLKGGGGGGGGAAGGRSANNSGSGGAGGGGGGIVWMSGRTLTRVSGSTPASCIVSTGGTGGAGSNQTSASSGDGGGGGGGGGGWIFLAYRTLAGSAVTNMLDAGGGTGGNAGSGGSTVPTAVGGNGGAGGRITIINILSGTAAETTGSAGSAASGATGGAGNSFKVNL